MGSLNRYAMVDAYTLEELRREYVSEDPKGRIRLLTKLKRAHALPFEITSLAVEDVHVGVRQFIAKHGFLDWRERRMVKGRFVYDENKPERNLKEVLKNDPDPFVRACLRENPSFPGANWQEVFKDSTHMERLALVRNENIRNEFIRQLFDFQEQELEISLDHRRELIIAVLTSGIVLARSTEEAGLSGFPQSWDGLTNHVSNTFLTNLWELASEWPTESGIPYLVYSYVPTNDETKATVYQKCTDPELRKQIIAYCNPREEFPETIALAKGDADEGCRKWAEDDYYGEHKAEFESDERILMPTLSSETYYPELKALEQKTILIGKKSLGLEEAVEAIKYQIDQLHRRLGTLIFVVVLVGVVAILAGSF